MTIEFRCFSEPLRLNQPLLQYCLYPPPHAESAIAAATAVSAKSFFFIFISSLLIAQKRLIKADLHIEMSVPNEYEIYGCLLLHYIEKRGPIQYAGCIVFRAYELY